MHVYESNNIRVSGYPLPLKLKIVDDLTIDNPAYLKAKYQRRPTWGIDQKLQLFTYDNDGSLILPRGYADRLYSLISETTTFVKWDREQVEGEPVDFGPWNENFQIRDYQHPLIDSLLRKNGIGVSPAGSGKTIMGMRYIYEVGRPTLWLTHTRDLVYQTRDRALSTLKGVGRVGILGDGVEDFGDRKLIIATVQTLKAKQRLVEKLKEFIGVVVIDEAHHFPSTQFLDTAAQFPAKRIIGLTATPKRKDEMEQLMYLGIGPVLHEVPRTALYKDDQLVLPEVKFIYTSFTYGNEDSADGNIDAGGEDLDYQDILYRLFENEDRLNLVAQSIVDAVKYGQSIVLSESVRYCFRLKEKVDKLLLEQGYRGCKTAVVHGKYILMPCADPFIAWIRLSQLLLPNKIKNPKRPYVGKGLKPMTKEVFGVQMSEFTSVLERNKALFFDQVPNDEHDALSYCCEDSDYAVQHYLYWDEVAKQISNDNEVYPTYSDWLKNIEMPFTRVTGIMEYWGMKWDSDIAQVKREEAKNAIEIAAQTMKDLAASVGIKDLNVGVGGKTKDVKSFVFDTLKLPAAAWSDKTKDPSLDSNALMDMIFMLENKLEDPDEEKYLETPLPEEWEMVDPDLSYQDQRLLWPREYTTAEVKRIRIARREEHPYKDIGIKFLKSMQTIQKYATLLSSHVEGREKYVNPVTGRIHAKYEPWTETARLASNSPNGQNVPRPDNDELGVRNFYKAEPGKVFLLEDESGFELRLTAWKSGCEVMRKAFRDHEDLHRKTAATMTGKPEAEVTKHERSGAKAGNFGSVYGGTEHALQKTFKKMGLRKSLPECKKIVDAVMKTYPGIPRMQADARVRARETGYAETIYGYKRLLPAINSSNRYTRSEDERRAANTPVQGSAADIMKRAQNTVYEKCGMDTASHNGIAVEPWDGYATETKELLGCKPFMLHGHTDMVAQIHDEIIVELDDDTTLVDTYAKWQKAVMEVPPLKDFPVQLEAEASVAYSWGNKMSLEDWEKARGL